MFKPYFGTCSNPNCKNSQDVLIPVKSGFCVICNHEQKQAKKKLSGKKTGKYVKESTGEKDVFQAVLDNLPDTITRCFVCGVRVAVVTHNNFAHVLPKGKYPKFRLNPDNIRILCHDIYGKSCHHTWDFKPRSELKIDPMWQSMFELEEQLKQKYKQLYER